MDNFYINNDQENRRRKRSGFLILSFIVVIISIFFFIIKGLGYWQVINNNKDQTNFSNKQEVVETKSFADYGAFKQCVSGDNIGNKGFLVKVLFINYDSEVHKLVVKCADQETEDIFYDEKTIFALISSISWENQVATSSLRLKFNKDERKAEEFLSDITQWEELQINLIKNSNYYYANNIYKVNNP